MQCVSAFDQGHAKELANLEAEPYGTCKMHGGRCMKLYGLLIGLMRRRTLQTVKAVAKSDGYARLDSCF